MGCKLESCNVEDVAVKYLLGFAVLAALGGCAVDQPHRGHYGNVSSAQPRDPSQWRVVSVTPVPAGTAARVAAKSPDGKPIEYSTSTVAAAPVYRPAAPYTPAPVYAPGSVYAPAPVYGSAPYYGYRAPVYAPQPAYYWPPVTLSLGFVFGRHWSRGHFGGRWRHR